MKLFSRKQRHLVFLLAPGLIFVLLLVGYGLLQAIIESIQSPDLSGEWTLNYYKLLFTDSMFWDSLALSLKITLLSTGISQLIGIFLTKWLYHYLLKEKWKLIIWIPMLIPHFVAGYIILFFFAQSGWFSALFYQLEWITERQEFPILVMDKGGDRHHSILCMERDPLCCINASTCLLPVGSPL